MTEVDEDKHVVRSFSCALTGLKTSNTFLFHPLNPPPAGDTHITIGWGTFYKGIKIKLI